MFVLTGWRKLVSGAIVVVIALAGLPLMISAVNAAQDDMDIVSVTRGGLLYDKWYKVIKAPGPEETHAAWPASNTNKDGATTWRCKSCHGWDMMGNEGAYSSGSYLTGIPGVTAMVNAPLADIIAILKDDTHGFDGMMDEGDFYDLANFVSNGQIDIDALINRETKAANGDAGQGGAYYGTLCLNCHGVDGDLPKDMGTTLGTLANKNPWEIIQKILNGQPAEQMPAMRAFDVQVSTDILAYLQTLPLDE